MRRRSWKDPIDGMAFDFFDGIRKGLGPSSVSGKVDPSDGLSSAELALIKRRRFLQAKKRAKRLL